MRVWFRCNRQNARLARLSSHKSAIYPVALSPQAITHLTRPVESMAHVFLVNHAFQIQVLLALANRKVASPIIPGTGPSQQFALKGDANREWPELIRIRFSDTFISCTPPHFFPLYFHPTLANLRAKTISPCLLRTVS